MHDDEIVTQLQQIKEFITKIPAFIRDPELLFVTPYRNPEFFYSKCFPILYPYGRGCPSDPNMHKSMRVVTAHTRHVLSRGLQADNRRFQQNKNYIFTLYTHIMKRRIGGIIFSASSEEDKNKQSITVGEINQLIAYVNEQEEHINNATLNEIEIKQMILRLVPYSTSLPGSMMHILNERK